MTRTTELNPENGTCIGCRLPWNEESVTGYCRNAVLVIADDAGMEVTEILLPLNTGEQKDLAAPEISTGQPIREVLIIPLEQSTSSGQMTQAEPEMSKKHSNREEPASSTEQSIPGEKLTPSKPDIPIKHGNREEPENSAERSTHGEKLTPAEQDIQIKHPYREKQGLGYDPDVPVKPAAPKGQKTQTEPELFSTTEIIIGVRV